MTNNTKNAKNAALKVFEAAKLTAGKYAGIPKGEESDFIPDPVQTYTKFEVKATRSTAGRTFAALTAEQAEKANLKDLGLFSIPRGLKAAARMARNVGDPYTGYRFAFSFDCLGRWGYEFDDPDGMASTDGSDEEPRGFSSELMEMQAVVWALANFDAVRLFVNNEGFYFLEVGEIDDGRLLLLNCGMRGEFTEPENDGTEQAGAVATYPAAKVAACEAPKADNSDESGENTKKSAENCKDSTKNGFKIEKNNEFGSIEIYFNVKPSQVVRDALKTAHFRWHGVKKCWYGYTDEETVRHMIEAADGVEAIKDENLNAEAVNVSGGVGVHPEAKTVSEAKETAKRDISKEFRRGDVVKITGTTNGRNGYFYVVNLHDDGTPYKLQGLKKCPKYDTFKDEATKNAEYWPLHTYANSPKVRAEFKEAVKFAKISNIGPQSLEAYRAMKRAHTETVEALERVKGRDGSGVYVNEWTKREAEERADLERMELENEFLKDLDQWKERHQKPEGPGLKICKNGLKVRNEDGTWEHYSLRIEKAHGYQNDAHVGEVEVWGSYYGHRSSTIPEGFGLEIINDSDSQTDYFEADRAFVKPDHPLFWAFAQAAEGGKPHTLTDDDAKRCAEYLEGKRAAADAERKAKEDAERAERERKDDELDRAIIDAVATYAEQYPATEGQATGRIIRSENGILNAEGSESGKNTSFSLAALDLIISEADHAHQRIFGPHSGYYKTRIRVELPDGDTLEDRIDIGDGVGGIYESHLHAMKWHTEQALTNGEDPKWVEAQKEGVEREAHILEMLRPWCDLGGLLVLNDLEALELGETA